VNGEDVNLKFLLKPKSIAVVGASADPGALNGKPIYYLQKHNYPGEIYPVNPSYGLIAGLKCYKSVREIQKEIDLALIMVNAKRVLSLLRECAEAGVKAAVIFSSGFAEIQGGRELQREIEEFARETGLIICGPNCQGIINLKDKVTASFTRALDVDPLLTGPVGFVTQSGAFGGAILNASFEAGLGFSYWISTGNEAVLKSTQVLKYLANDPEVKIIGAYLEGLENGTEFVEAVQMAHRRNCPVVVLKAGSSEAGQKAAASHTGALAGSARVFETACRQFGVIRVHDIDEFVKVTKALANGYAAKGKNIGIVTTSGGAGAIMADICTELGLNMAAPSQDTKLKLHDLLVEFSAVENPVDVTAQVTGKLLSKNPKEADAFKESIKTLLADPGVDVGIVILTMVEGKRAEKAALDIVEAMRAVNKPVIVTWLAGNLARSGYDILEKNGALCFHNLRDAALTARAVGQGVIIQSVREKQSVGSPPKIASGRGVLTEWESKSLLARHGIPVARGELATDSDSALRAAERIGYPVVMKVVSPDIPHKTEAGVVLLNVSTPQEVKSGYEELISRAWDYRPGAVIDGVLVEEMIPPEGVEVFIGVKEDKSFGPTVVFGLGGIFVEVLKDVALRLAPVDKAGAMGMIREIKGYPLLAGTRGKPMADVESLADVIAGVSQLAFNLGGQIREMDINPLIVFPMGKGVKAADALIKINRI